MPGKGSGQLCDGCAAAGLPALKAAAEGHVKCLSKAFATDRQRSLACDSKGATALHLAARGGRLECVKWLLAKSGISPTVRAKNGESPLHLSAAAGHLGCLQYFVTHNKSCASAVDKYCQTPLHLAVLRDRTKCAKWLLDIAKADPVAVTSTGATPLHFACAQGFLSIVQLLLGYMSEEDVDIQDNEGTAPLYYAAQGGHLAVVEELVQCRHAKVLATSNDGMTPLHAAAQSGQLDILQWLHKWLRGKHLMDKTTDGATLLHFASSMGKTQCLIWLLSQEECAAVVNVNDKSGSTPAHDAAENGQLECLQVLVSHGADIKAKDNEGYTPYDLAFHGEHDECAAFLKAEETRRKGSTLTRQTPVRTKNHQKRMVNGDHSRQTTGTSGSRYRDKQLFNPTYSASSLMKALPDRMSSASSFQADVAEIATLEDDLDFDGQSDPDESHHSSLQNISTAHMLPALREQLEAMGVLAANLQVMDVQSGLPPLGEDFPRSSTGSSFAGRRLSDGGGDGGGDSDYLRGSTRNDLMHPSVSMEAISRQEKSSSSESDAETRSLSDELHRSTVCLTTERPGDYGGRSSTDLTANLNADGSGAEQVSPKKKKRIVEMAPQPECILDDVGIVDQTLTSNHPASDQITTEVKGPIGAVAGVVRTQSNSMGARPSQLGMEADADEQTPKVSPTCAAAPLAVEPPRVFVEDVDGDGSRPLSTASDGSVVRTDAAPLSTPLLGRHSSAVSHRLKFIEGSTPSRPAPDDVVEFQYDARGIPIPPPAPTPSSLMSGVVSLQTVAADKVPKWMRRYRRGWLAKAIGDQVSPEEELMVVLRMRKRQVDGFDNMIAKRAAQMALAASRPVTPSSPPGTPSSPQPDTPPLEGSPI